MGVKLPIKKEVAQWYAQMKKYATCCSFVAQLNCNKTEKQWILNRSYFKIHLFGQDFPPPKKVQPTFLPSCDIQKKKTELHHDSIHPESSLKQTLQQDLSIIFIDFRKTKPYIYISLSLWGYMDITRANKWCDIHRTRGKPMSKGTLWSGLHGCNWHQWPSAWPAHRMATDGNPLIFSVSAWAW